MADLTMSLSKLFTFCIRRHSFLQSSLHLQRVPLRPLNRAIHSSTLHPDRAYLSLRNHDVSFDGELFGARPANPNSITKSHQSIASVSGEVVFTTSLVGYPESMTDPSYQGQILVFTQPLIGNYGVPSDCTDEWGLSKNFESERVHVKAIIVNDYATKYSHWAAVESLGSWCKRHGVVGLTGVDTRAIVSFIREKGSCMGVISSERQEQVGWPNKNEGKSTVSARNQERNEHLIPTSDPSVNHVAQVSTKSKIIYNHDSKYKIALIDCGVKHNIIRLLIENGAQVHRLPWNHDLTTDSVQYDGVFISNGPGNPLSCMETVKNLRKIMKQRPLLPIFGICMGNQLLGLAAGYSTYKMPFGNRGHNQPAINLLTGKCVITSQNHGYALKDDNVHIEGWQTFYRNANDGTNEGIRHLTLPYSSVQFHPEAKGGPKDTEHLFEEFMAQVVNYHSQRIRLTALPQSSTQKAQHTRL